MALNGIPNASPIPRRGRQFKPAAGTGLGAGSLRPVVLVGNKLAAGTEVLETLGGPIQDLADCIARFGRRSEIYWMYVAYVAVDPNPLIYAVAVAEGQSATASTVSYTFTGAASVNTVLDIDSVKGRLQVLVTLGDSVATQVTNAAAAIGGDPDLPFSAQVPTTATTIASGSNSVALPTGTINVASTTGFPTSGTVLIGTLNTLVSYTGLTSTSFTGCTGGSGTLLTAQTVTVQGQLLVTTYQKGPRSAGWINQLRIASDDPTNATIIAKGTVAAGSVADSVANAIVAVDKGEFTYHALACTSQSSVTSSDGGVGQYMTYIASAIAPTGGKSSMAILAVDGTSAQATAVMQSACVNQVFSHCYRVKNNDWHSSMVAAHHAAVHRSTEVNYAAVNLTNWSNNSALGQVYQIPDPFNKADRPTSVDETTDLNGGVSTVGFRTDGSAYIVRSVTGYSWTGSSTTSDFRAREGHLPSVLIQFWEDFEAQLITQFQPNVAADPPAAGKPVAGFMYPRGVKSIANTLITNMTRAYQNNMALLDPSILPQMIAATDVSLGAAGFQVNVAIGAVRHNLFDDTLISEIGSGVLTPLGSLTPRTDARAS